MRAIVRTVRKIDGNYKRYDIQTKKNNNFFANGILVHNSLITLYWWDGEWRVCTRGMPFADGPIGDYEATFSELFWDVIERKYPDFAKYLRNGAVSKSANFVFELCGPMNRIVTPYAEADVRLIAIRPLGKPEERWFYVKSFAEQVGLLTPKEWSVTDYDKVTELLGTLDELDEGFVVLSLEERRDTPCCSCYRVKVKSPSYLAASRIVGNGPFVKRRALELVLQGNDTVREFLAYFPEHSERVLGVQEQYDRLVKRSTEDAARLIDGNPSDREDRKRMALSIKKEALVPSVIFPVMAGRHVTAKESIDSVRSDRLLEILESI